MLSAPRNRPSSQPQPTPRSRGRTRARLLSALLLAGSATFVACQPGDGVSLAGLEETPAPIEGYFAGLPSQPEAQRAQLCARGNQDSFAAWYCAGATAPTVTSLDQLLIALKIKDPANGGFFNFAMNGNSMSLVGRNTSPLNPRVIYFTPAFINDVPVAVGGGTTPPDGSTTTDPSSGSGSGSSSGSTTTSPGATPTPSPTAMPSPVPTDAPTNPAFLALGFARGSHLVEVAAFDPAKQDINFYLLRYGKSCDPNCGNDELFTDRTERNWTSLTVYADSDLHNTPLDCLVCHEPNGDGTKRILRMQERQFPWAHWFFPNGVFAEDPPVANGGDGGASPSPVPASTSTASAETIGPDPATEMIQRLITAHPEGYGDIPADQFFSSAPFLLEELVESNGFFDQPNEFDSVTIENEGRGPTWLGIYQNAIDGNAISVPSYEIDPSDPTLRRVASDRYVNALGGQPGAGFPNMAAIYNPGDLGDLGFQATRAAKTGRDVVAHRCAFCHNGKFPGISRNNFDWRDFPDNLSAGERQAILSRIRLDRADPHRMPPVQFCDLTEHQIELIEASLLSSN